MITHITDKELALTTALQRMTDALNQATAERDALKADAERYRWLRDKSRSVDWSRYVNVESTPPCTAYSTTCRATGDQMNEAIDRAMKGTS